MQTTSNIQTTEERIELWFKELKDFFEDDNKFTKHIILNRRDVDKFEERLYLQDINVEITEKKDLKSRVRVTLQKM